MKVPTRQAVRHRASLDARPRDGEVRKLSAPLRAPKRDTAVTTMACPHCGEAVTMPVASVGALRARFRCSACAKLSGFPLKVRLAYFLVTVLVAFTLVLVLKLLALDHPSTFLEIGATATVLVAGILTGSYATQNVCRIVATHLVKID